MSINTPTGPIPFRSAKVHIWIIIPLGLLIQFLVAFGFFGEDVPSILVSVGFWTFWPAWAIHVYWAYWHWINTKSIMWTTQGFILGTFSYYVIQPMIAKQRLSSK